MTKPPRQRPTAASVKPQTLTAKREGIYTGNEVAAEPGSAPAPEAKAPPKKKPVTFSADVELMDRARAAVLLTQYLPNGYRSLTHFIEAAIEDKLSTAADEFNEGRPIEPLSGAFRTGRPLQR